jgi:hypothetical protein
MLTHAFHVEELNINGTSSLISAIPTAAISIQLLAE